MDVTISRSVFTRRRTAPARRPTVEQAVSNVDLETYNIARIKSDPGDDIYYELNRPISQVCNSCVVNSQAVIYRNYLALGSHNCFLLRTMDKTNSFYVRMMPELWHYIRLPNVFTGMKTITPEELETVANSMLKDAVHKLPMESTTLDLKMATRFIQMFESFRSRMSSSVVNICVKITAWILGKLFSYSFEAVCVHYGELELIRAALSTGLPVVFVPLHRSHLDPFLISWTMFNRELRPPAFITPHSLIHTPIFGWLAKLLGGLGCHQRRRAVTSGYLNPDINISLLSYIHLLWTKGNSVMIPVETHRSRTGKPSSCLVGKEFFNVLLNLYENREIEDAFVIPVSVNYDILPEEDLITDYFQEHAGPKPSFFKWLFRLNKNLGFARISYSQPFRLREFKLAQPKPTPSYLSAGDWKTLPVTGKASVAQPGSEFNWIEEFGSVASLSSIYGETDFMTPENRDVQKTDAIIEHSFFDATRTTVIMSTHIVAFLLLNKFKNGVDVEQLILEFEILEVEIRSLHKRDTGFTADNTVYAVDRAITLLGGGCIHKYKKDGLQWVKPDSRKSSLVKLNYYSNHLVQLFVIRGVIATSVVNAYTPAIFAYADFTFTRSKPITVDEADVISKALQIAELLKFEFPIHPPCKSMTGVVIETLEKMMDIGDFHLHDVTKKIYQDEDDLHDYDYNSDGEVPMNPSSLGLVLNNTSKVLSRLKFQRSLIIPYLELYGVAVQSLKLLLPPLAKSSEASPLFTGMEDITLRKHIYTELDSSFRKGYLRNEELITMDTIRNFLHTMENMDVVKFYADTDTEFLKMYYLLPSFEASTALDTLSTIILEFCN